MRLLLSVVALAMLAIVAAAAALTLPSIATPIARALLSGRAGATVERAWVSYEPAPVAHLRSIEIEGRGHAEAVDARLNPLGVLPGAALVPRLSVTGGAVRLERGPAQGSGPPLLDEIVGVDLERVRLDIHRPEREPQLFTISSAEGDLPVGAFTLQGEGGGARVTMQGDAEAFTLEGFRGRFRAEGDNFARLAELLGFAAPDTPPYALSGDLSRSGRTWRLADFSGKVGDSDLGGEMTIDFAGARPLVRAALFSRTLDFDDLGVIVGAPSDLEDAEENARQQAIADQYRDGDRLIPDTKLDVDRLNAVDADVSFRADAVQAGAVPLDRLDARMLIEDSVLRFERLDFAAPQGRLRITGEIDARDPARAAGSLQGSLSGFELAQLADGALLRGELKGEFDLTFSGLGTRDAFASATGEAAAWSTDAELRALAQEAAELNVLDALSRVLAGDETPEFRPARCLVVRAVLENGVARLDPAVVDTRAGITRIDGTVDLETEALDLEVASSAKDMSFGSLLGGAVVSGTLRDPSFSPQLGKVALQSGAAALLAGISGGLAALPFIDPGAGADAPCGALLERARSHASGAGGAAAADEDDEDVSN